MYTEVRVGRCLSDFPRMTKIVHYWSWWTIWRMRKGRQSHNDEGTGVHAKTEISVYGSLTDIELYLYFC